FEDLHHGAGVETPVERPTDDVEVFLTGLETVEDAVEEESVVVKPAFEEAEVAAVQLDPEAFALQMFEPAGAQVTPPMTLDPAADGGFAKIATGLFALNPLETQRFLL